MTKDDLLDIRRAVLDALAFLETLRRGPDGEHGNGGHDRERVEDIYKLAGNPLSVESRDAMMRYAQQNPQGVNGRVIYRLEDFGLDGAELREEFRFYTDHFDLQLES